MTVAHSWRGSTSCPLGHPVHIGYLVAAAAGAAVAVTATAAAMAAAMRPRTRRDRCIPPDSASQRRWSIPAAGRSTVGIALRFPPYDSGPSSALRGRSGLPPPGMPQLRGRSGLQRPVTPQLRGSSGLRGVGRPRVGGLSGGMAWEGVAGLPPRAWQARSAGDAPMDVKPADHAKANARSRGLQVGLERDLHRRWPLIADLGQQRLSKRPFVSKVQSPGHPPVAPITEETRRALVPGRTVRHPQATTSRELWPPDPSEATTSPKLWRRAWPRGPGRREAPVSGGSGGRVLDGPESSKI